MAVNISVNKNKQIKEDIKVTSIVKCNKDNDIYMIVKNDYGVGSYSLLDLKAGTCYAQDKCIEDLIDNYDLELVTNDINLILNNPKVDIDV